MWARFGKNHPFIFEEALGFYATGFNRPKGYPPRANTAQSKKRARQADARQDVNKARRSRIRTFLRKVEEALTAGNADAAATA